MTDPTEHPDLAHAEFVAELNLGMAVAYKAALEDAVETALRGDGTGQIIGFLADRPVPAVYHGPTGDTPVSQHGTFTCDNCHQTFDQGWSDEDATAEAETAGFTPAELADPAVVCDDCWQAMRAAMPDLDAMYRQERTP